MACFLLAATANAQIFINGNLARLDTGSGQALLSLPLTLEINPAFQFPKLHFSFGFTTDETATAGSFADSMTLTLQNANHSSTAILLTTDAHGTIWAPPSEGTVALSSDSILRMTASWPSEVSLLAANQAYQVSASVPAGLTDSPVTLYFDLFNNQDERMSRAWINDLLVLPGAPIEISGAVHYFDRSRTVPGVSVKLSGDVTSSVTNAGDGIYRLVAGAGGNYSVTPARTNDTPASLGVTTLDITLIRRHILGIASLDTPYKVIAADVNNSSNVTTLDITLIRRLILGITNSLPAGLWRFVRSDYAFTNVLAPWGYETNRTYSAVTTNVPGQDFLAIKLGDVNASWATQAGAAPLVASQGQDQVSPPLAQPVRLQTMGGSGVTFSMGQTMADHGSMVTVPVTASGFAEVTSAQFTLRWDPAVLQWAGALGYGLPGLSEENFGTSPMAKGQLTFSWDTPDGNGVSLADGTEVFAIQFRVVGRDGMSSRIEFADQPTPREVTRSLNLTGFVGQSGTLLVGKEALRPTLTVSRLAGGQIQLRVRGVAGTDYTLQRSTDLSEWVPLLKTNASSDVFDAIDPVASKQPLRFYRVVNQE